MDAGGFHRILGVADQEPYTAWLGRGIGRDRIFAAPKLLRSSWHCRCHPASQPPAVRIASARNRNTHLTFSSKFPEIQGSSILARTMSNTASFKSGVETAARKPPSRKHIFHHDVADGSCYHPPCGDRSHILANTRNAFDSFRKNDSVPCDRPKLVTIRTDVGKLGGLTGAAGTEEFGEYLGVTFWAHMSGVISNPDPDEAFMIWMKSRYDRLNQCSTSALGHLMSLKERAMRRRERSDLEASLEHVCRSDNIRKDASTSPTPRVPRRSHEILRDLGMSDGEITEYFYRF